VPISAKTAALPKLPKPLLRATPASGFAATGMQIERKPGQNTDFSVRCDQNWSIRELAKRLTE
jgi:hypothetical protein